MLPVHSVSIHTWSRVRICQLPEPDLEEGFSNSHECEKLGSLSIIIHIPSGFHLFLTHSLRAASSMHALLKTLCEAS